MVSLMLNKLDFGNAVLVGLPAYLMRRLQSIQNASARLIYQLRCSAINTEQRLNNPR